MCRHIVFKSRVVILCCVLLTIGVITATYLTLVSIARADILTNASSRMGKNHTLSFEHMRVRVSMTHGIVVRVPVFGDPEWQAYYWYAMPSRDVQLVK
jgi:hypothetical protein